MRVFRTKKESSSWSRRRSPSGSRVNPPRTRTRWMPSWKGRRMVSTARIAASCAQARSPGSAAATGRAAAGARRGGEEGDWGLAEGLLQSQNVTEGAVGGYNRGGLIVKVGNLRGFIPASQISLARRRRSEGETPEKRWGKMVGEPILAKVIEVDRRRNRLILSARAAAARGRRGRRVAPERRPISLSMRELLPDPWQTTVGGVEEGQLVEGTVTKLTKFGAFATLRLSGDFAVEGLIHISELSDRRIEHPKEAVQEGQTVTLRVIKIDRPRQRIGLRLKRVAPAADTAL